MLINQNELETMCLNKSAIEQLKAQVFNQFTRVGDPLYRYAVCRVLLNVLSDVCTPLSTQAEMYCEQHNLGVDGKEFIHQDLWFSRQFNLTYDYANNATDDEGKVLDYRGKEAEIERKKRSLNIANGELKSMKAKIELAHPNMKPKVDSIVLKFQGTLVDFPD